MMEAGVWEDLRAVAVSVFIRSNPALTAITLNHIETIGNGGGFPPIVTKDLDIKHNDALVSIAGLTNLTMYAAVEHHIVARYPPSCPRALYPRLMLPFTLHGTSNRSRPNGQRVEYNPVWWGLLSHPPPPPNRPPVDPQYNWGNRTGCDHASTCPGGTQPTRPTVLVA